MVAAILEILKLGILKLMVIFSFYLCFLITLGWCNESLSLIDLLTVKAVEIFVLSFLTFLVLGILFPVLSVVALRKIGRIYAEKEITSENYKDNHFYIVDGILWLLKALDIDRDEFAGDMIFILNDLCRYGVVVTTVILQIALLSGETWTWLLFGVSLLLTFMFFVSDYSLKRVQLLNELNRDS